MLSLYMSFLQGAFMLIMFILGLVLGFLVLFIAQSLRLKRFDLSDQLLNLSPPKTLWGNLGYWKSGMSYSEAASNLAETLANKAELKENDRLLDVGFGSGEQLKLWHSKFNVSDVTGFNPSQAQTAYAQALLKQEDINYQILAESHQYTAQQTRKDFTKILAVDCAYFFRNRHQWFADCKDVMAPNSKLVLTDFILHCEPKSWLSRAMLKLAFAMCGIPLNNLTYKTNYINSLQFAGLSNISFEDISEPVIDGFCEWLPQYQNQFPGIKPLPIWSKYSGTVKLLTWLRKHDIIGYYLISAERLK